MDIESRAVSEYTFEGTIQTMTFFQKGEVKAWGRSEQEARRRAIQEICRIHRVGTNCVRLGKVVNIRH